MIVLLPSAWLFSLVGTAAAPPVSPAAWWHPSQTTTTPTHWNSHWLHTTLKNSSARNGKQKKSEALINSSLPACPFPNCPSCLCSFDLLPLFFPRLPYSDQNPCSDRYEGILTEREGNEEREGKRGSNLREETSEGWQKWMSIRKSFIQPGLPPPAEPAKNRTLLWGQKGTVTPHGRLKRGGMDRDQKVWFQEKNKNIFELSCDAAQRRTMDPDQTQRAQVQAC